MSEFTKFAETEKFPFRHFFENIYLQMSQVMQYAVVVLNIEAFTAVKQDNPSSLVQAVHLFADRNGAVLKLEQELAKYDVQAGYSISKERETWKVYQVKRVPGAIYGAYKEKAHVFTYEIVAVSQK